MRRGDTELGNANSRYITPSRPCQMFSGVEVQGRTPPKCLAALVQHDDQTTSAVAFKIYDVEFVRVGLMLRSR